MRKVHTKGSKQCTVKVTFPPPGLVVSPNRRTNRVEVPAVFSRSGRWPSALSIVVLSQVAHHSAIFPPSIRSRSLPPPIEDVVRLIA